jgi:hypothetical protein
MVTTASPTRAPDASKPAAFTVRITAAAPTSIDRRNGFWSSEATGTSSRKSSTRSTAGSASTTNCARPVSDPRAGAISRSAAVRCSPFGGNGFVSIASSALRARLRTGEPSGAISYAFR